MRKFRINNDVPITWRIMECGTLLPFDLEGKTVRVSVQSRFGIEPIEEFSINGNVISFIFKASQQRVLGVYAVTAVITDEAGQTWSTDGCQMFELVARSCCVDVCDCQGVDATSCVEFSQFVVVDQEVLEGSENPVAGGAVFEAINSLKRVFMYHVDTESDTPAVIETGDDLINNSAVLDWLFRNGADGVDSIEAKVPCVVVAQTGDSGFDQNVFGCISANCGEEDGLVFFNAFFSSQISEVNMLINAYYSRSEGSTTWNNNQLVVSIADLQTVEDTPVERGSGAYSVQQKAEPGSENDASGFGSTVEGIQNEAGADAHFAHVGGTKSTATHEGTMIHGRGLRSGAKDQAVVGRFNEPSADALLQVGGGTSDTDRETVFEVKADGQVVILRDGEKTTITEELEDVEAAITEEASERANAINAAMENLRGEIADKELKLTVKDNGNIVLSNIDGQTKEFMPATPSGDPMHYAYEELGFVYNSDTNTWNYTIPSLGLNVEGITSSEMKAIYANSVSAAIPYAWSTAPLNKVTLARWASSGYLGGVDISSICQESVGDCEAVVFSRSSRFDVKKMDFAFYRAGEPSRIKGIYPALYCHNLESANHAFDKLAMLINIFLNGIKTNIHLGQSSDLSYDSVRYAIANRSNAVGSPITLTLHETVYNKIMSEGGEWADLAALLPANGTQGQMILESYTPTT